MTPRRTTAKDLKRTTANRPERRTVVVFCEGEASEPDYINALKRLPEVRANTALNVVIDPTCGVPLTLVRAAAEKLNDPEIDECWCVFDVEWPQNHPHLHRALKLAADKGIRVAVSNPCFELWLVLHHRDQAAFLDNKSAEALSRQLDGRSGKRLDGARYMALRQDASRRAAALVTRHRRNGTQFPNDNPSSSMHEFLAAVERPPSPTDAADPR
ncbi:RloB family protein [Kribbella flavida]|uniref:RloB family protein n=1 Tax=Kribbella flavida TaxID=182640 RepID=UPI0009FD950B|nr:RloB family protein [Kribbella flavida]